MNENGETLAREIFNLGSPDPDVKNVKSTF